MVMGVTYGKKREHNPQHASTGSWTHVKGPVHCALQREEDGQQGGEDLGLNQEQVQSGDMLTLPSQPYDQEESSDLIIPQKLINPVKVSKNHQELHKELKMTYKRTVCPEGKPELQRVLEKRNWEQGRKQKREEEAKRNTSPFHQELLKRQQRLEELERELDLQQNGQDSSPEFIRVRESLRRTTILDAGEKKV
ncbi:protein FAM107B-like isoform X3 [Osmerus eperlanus]|uniref:protein FAM107B-like isoform X3 n=1 Tax=Osmerus eperlanus TaxID=29151 RepID=UPI002E0DA7AC